jgi:hypothetical protein
MLLKTVMIPVAPPQGLVERYMMMYANEDMSVAGLIRILEMKGVRKGDMAGLVSVLEAKLGGVQGRERNSDGKKDGRGFGSFFRKSKK